MAYRKVQISIPNVLDLLVLHASTSLTETQSQNILLEADGVDDISTISVITAKKLFAPGSWVVEQFIEDRSIRIKGAIYLGSESENDISLKNTIENAVEEFYQWTLKFTGRTVRTEKGYLTAYSWKEVDSDNAEVELSFTIPSGTF